MDLHEDGAQKTGNSRLLPLTVTAIGVVYGDIGTSPLYTIRECFFGAHAVALNHDNVLGVLSLILYALLIETGEFSAPLLAVQAVSPHRPKSACFCRRWPVDNRRKSFQALPA